MRDTPERWINRNGLAKWHPPIWELVRSISVAWERGDFSAVEWADPAIEFVIADGPAQGEWTGLTAMSDAWGAWLSAFQGVRIVVDDCRELDGGRVFMLVRGIGRGKASGLPVTTTKGANLFHVRAGKVTRLVTYIEDRERAMVDAGVTTKPGRGRS